MFVRASRRSLQKDARRQSIPNVDIPQLLFLCPVLLSQPIHRRKTSTASRSRSVRGLKNTQAADIKNAPYNASTHRRTLASAAAAEIDLHQDYHIPWDPASFPRPNSLPPVDEHKITIPPFDPQTSPIIINDALSTPPASFYNTRHEARYVGNINDLHQTLHACLQVGRVERATILLRKLNQLYNPEAPGLLAAHNEYIKALSYKVVRNNDLRVLQDLQRWFEVELRDVGIRPNELTYALMIQASLQASGSKKDRMVRRYLGLAGEYGLAEGTKDLLSAFEKAEVAQAILNISSNNSKDSGSQVTDVAGEHASFPITIDQTTGEIPEVKEMLQKGEGLSTLKKSLSMFRSLPAGSPSIALSSPEEIEHSQKRLERDTLEASVERWRVEGEHLKSMGINIGLTNATVGAMMWEWHSKLVPLIEEDIGKSRELEEKATRTIKEEEFLLWAPFLQTLSPEKLSAATILTAVAACCTDRLDERGCTLHHIVSRIGNAVQDEFYAQTIRDDKEHAKWRNLLKLTKSTRRYGSLAKLVHQTVAESEDQLEWYKETRIRLGAGLLARLMETAKVQVTREDPVTKAQVRDLQPVFFHGFQYMKGKRVGVVLFNSEIFEQFVNKPVNSALAKHLPMISKPRPWVGWREGGYLDHSVSVIRIDRSEDQARRYAITACENGDLSQIFAGLDVLGQTAWKINRFVFDTMLSIWNTGKGFAKIPPEETAEAPPTPPTSEDPRERAIFKRRQSEYNNHKSGLKSQRCYQNFQLEVARSYLNQTMYFPHNIDFRGRAYPVPPFLNHMGADNCRGLLLFAQGRELGAQGLWWLKVHLANVYGYDKASFDDRLKFTEAHLTDIYDSVDNPLGGSKWWLGAEDPWQCLAACKELTSALQLPDPTRYVCQLPIHQDGTCNGLQHYAALGGDISGAQQVNLEPGPRPSDIYTGVAEIVKADIAKDATNGNELAKYLDGKITRKIVKQTVMTNVYGVTFIGAKRQVLRQLEDLFPDFPDTTAVNRHAAAIYIARGIFKALGNLFNGAHDIQYWLTDSAARISESISPEQVAYLCKDMESQKSQSQFKATVRKAKGDPIAAFKSAVIWTTPLKLPVVQPYRKADARRINTSLQSIAIRDATSSNPVDKAKQVQAFPPNFIHSLDATHMFLTALKCHEIGIGFASIHDSFWTHAGDVDTMNRVIREAFIRMHSEDIIGRLAAEFRARYGNHMHLASVPADSEVGRDILAWRSNTRGGSRNSSLHRKIDAQKVDELKLEQRRLTLLASSDPKEKEEGENLITAAQMFEQTANEETLTPTDVPTTTLGGMKRSTSDFSSRSAKLKANKQLEVGDLENAEAMESAVLDVEDDHDIELSTSADDEDSPEVEDAMDDSDEDPKLPDELEVSKAKGKRGRKKNSNVQRNQKVWLWLPLKFAPVPRKGDFDVTRLKNSQYFFS